MEQEEISWRKALEERFGSKHVQELLPAENGIGILIVSLPGKQDVRLLMTDGLSSYKMPVPPAESEFAHRELYFCLPGYWDLDDLELFKKSWVVVWIKKLANFVVENHSWFGHGHTLVLKQEHLPLSSTMKQNHLFLSNPIFLEDELETFVCGTKKILPLSIIPIFEDEMDYKQGKGTVKFMRKLLGHGVTEKLDDYRKTVLKSKWRWG